MKKLSKLILPGMLIAVIAFFYFTYFASSDELGSFSKFSPGSEINQEITVTIDKSKDFERDASGNITSFYVKDKNGLEVQVSSHEPIPGEIVNAEVVELLGHMHENSITTSKITIIK